MPEFLVHTTITLPPGMPEEERVALYARESAAAEPYFENGMFVRVWRVAGNRDHYALWDATDADAVHCAYESFPLYQLNYARAEVIPLAVNKNDPVWRGKQLTANLPVQLTYPALYAWLNDHGTASTHVDEHEGRTAEIVPGVTIHDHPGSGRPRELHFMVDGQKVAEIGPTDAPAGDVGPGYVDLLAEWAGRPVEHGAWQDRILADNDLGSPALHDSYDTALNAPRVRKA